MDTLVRGELRPVPQKGSKTANTVRAPCLSRRAILETEG